MGGAGPAGHGGARGLDGGCRGQGQGAGRGGREVEAGLPLRRSWAAASRAPCHPHRQSEVGSGVPRHGCSRTQLRPDTPTAPPVQAPPTLKALLLASWL